MLIIIHVSQLHWWIHSLYEKCFLFTTPCLVICMLYSFSILFELFVFYEQKKEQIVPYKDESIIWPRSNLVKMIITVVSLDFLLVELYFERSYDPDWICVSVVTQAITWCRSAMVMMQYSVMANNYWLLVEGIYLHSLLVITVFSEKKYFYIYMAIGWGKNHSC